MAKIYPPAFGYRGRNIRGTFFSQIKRDIPVEMFRCLVRTIKSC